MTDEKQEIKEEKRGGRDLTEAMILDCDSLQMKSTFLNRMGKLIIRKNIVVHAARLRHISCKVRHVNGTRVIELMTLT